LSNLTETLRLEYENTIQLYPDADFVMERVRGVLSAIARLEGCTAVSVGERLKWTIIVQNMVDTGRNVHQLLKGKQLCIALYGVYTEVLQDLMAVLKESAAKEERTNTTITAAPSVEEFREQRRRKRKHRDEADRRAKKPTTPTMEVNDHPNCGRIQKFPHGTSSPP
jgi:hypothetical protein